MILFPAVDLKNGQCVRLEQGDMARALAVFQVNRRKKNHGFHFKKFEIKARPKRWLFSG